jgi:two-component system KDP operon response regulator KdpE
MKPSRILVVDDDADLRRGLHVLLKASGYEVVFAADGLSSVSVARKEQPDAIILDLGLPAGDGYDVMKRLRAMIPLAQIPIVVLTAKDAATNRERALDAGASYFVEKPFENEDLLACVREALGETRSPEAS